MSYRIVKPMLGVVCPCCGKRAYLEETDETGDVRFAVWCIGKRCTKNNAGRYSASKKDALNEFLKTGTEQA